jgi:hypothetical protein
VIALRTLAHRLRADVTVYGDSKIQGVNTTASAMGQAMGQTDLNTGVQGAASHMANGTGQSMGISGTNSIVGNDATGQHSA